MKLIRGSTVIMFSLMSMSLGCMKGIAANEKNEENDYTKNEVKAINNSLKLEGIPVKNSKDNQERIAELWSFDEEKAGNNANISDSSKVEKLALKLREELKKREEIKELKQWQDEEFGYYEEEEQSEKFSEVIYENSEPNCFSEAESIYENITPNMPEDLTSIQELKKNSELNRDRKETTIKKNTQLLGECNVENELVDENFDEPIYENIELNNSDEPIYEDIELNNSDEPIYEDIELNNSDEYEFMVKRELREDSEINGTRKEIAVKENAIELGKLNLFKVTFDKVTGKEFERNDSADPTINYEIQKKMKLNKIEKEQFQKRDELENEAQFENQRAKQNLNEVKEEELLKTVLELFNHNYSLENKKINVADTVKDSLLKSENKIKQKQGGVKAIINQVDVMEKNRENKLKTTNKIPKKNEKNIVTSKKENLNEFHTKYLCSKTEQSLGGQQEMTILKNHLNKLREGNKSNLNKMNDLVYILEQLEKKLDKVVLSKSTTNYTAAKKDGGTTKPSNKKLMIKPVELLLSICSLLYIYKLKNDF